MSTTSVGGVVGYAGRKQAQPLKSWAPISFAISAACCGAAGPTEIAPQVVGTVAEQKHGHAKQPKLFLVLGLVNLPKGLHAGDALESAARDKRQTKAAVQRDAGVFHYAPGEIYHHARAERCLERDDLAFK